MVLGRLKLKHLFFVALLMLCILHARNVSAQNFTSTTYTILNPLLAPGDYSTSTSFRLTSTRSQFSIGTSTATTYGVRAGFLYFPFATTPAVSATAGDAQVSLTWTSASAGLGWTVGGYNVGRSTVSSGPYTFTSVGNVLAATVSSLTNGTAYYFVVQALDSFGNSIATSTEVSATPAGAVSPPPPTPTPTPPPSGGGGGGGGGGASPPAPSPTPTPAGTADTAVIFSGRAYPSTEVTLLKDATVAAKTIAGGDAKFEITLKGMSAGSYTFSLYGTDTYGNRSSLFTFPVTLTLGATVRIGGIFIAPTVDVDKSEVKKGDTVRIFGQTSNDAEVVISVHSEEEFLVKTTSDTDGIYFYNFDTTPLEIGPHTSKSKAIVANEISTFGKSVAFKVGTQSIDKSKRKILKGDLNYDGHVNLIDYSIGAFWYKRTLSEAFKPVEAEALNNDQVLNLTDFSIMAYYLTG